MGFFPIHRRKRDPFVTPSPQVYKISGLAAKSTTASVVRVLLYHIAAAVTMIFIHSSLASANLPSESAVRTAPAIGQDDCRCARRRLKSRAKSFVRKVAFPYSSLSVLSGGETGTRSELTDPTSLPSWRRFSLAGSLGHG